MKLISTATAVTRVALRQRKLWRFSASRMRGYASMMCPRCVGGNSSSASSHSISQVSRRLNKPPLTTNAAAVRQLNTSTPAPSDEPAPVLLLSLHSATYDVQCSGTKMDRKELHG